MCCKFTFDVANFIGVLVAFVGAHSAYKQWKAKKIYELLDKTRTDDGIKRTVSYIDWDGNGHDIKYNGHFTVDDDESRTRRFKKNINIVLSIYSHICQLYFDDVLKECDIRPFEYAFQRIGNSRAVSNYLYSLYHFAKAQGVDMSFTYLARYCLKKKYLADDFKCPNSDNYEYHLEKNAKYQEYLAKHSCEHCK